MGYKNAEDRRAYQRQYMRERRQWLHAHHLCADCKKEDAYTMVGHWYCAECAEKKRKSYRDPIPPAPKESEIPKSEWVAYGLCQKCGKHPIANKEVAFTGRQTVLCESCFEKSSAQAKRLAAMQKENFSGLRKSYELYKRRSMMQRGITPRTTTTEAAEPFYADKKQAARP